VFLAPLTPEAADRALVLQRRLRQAGVRTMLDPEGRSFKSRMKQADKLGARYVAILGEDEMARGVWTVRDMAGSAQEDVPEAGIFDHLKEKANG
jgi:histidyl-tRNA synthetase